MDNNRGKKALKAGAWYTVSSIAVKAIAIITTPIFTRMLSTYDYGISSTFVSWYTLLAIFSSLNLTYSIGRAKQDFEGQLEKYVGSMQVLSALFSLLLDAVMLIFIEPLSKVMELNPGLMVLLCCYLFFEPAITFTQSRFRYSYNYKGNIAISLFVAISNVATTFAFILALETDKYYGKVLGNVIPCVLLSLFFWILAIKNKSLSINSEYWKYGLKISLPLILHTVSLNILSQSDRILISKFCGSEYTGIYSLAYNYAILINIVMNAVNEAWLPYFHDTYFDGDILSIRKNVKPLIMLGCFLGIGCIALAPEAMAILGPKEYRVGMWAVAPVTAGIVCKFIYQQYVHIELHLKKTGYISAGTMIAAALNFVLNIIFIPPFGFVAAAYTTLFSYFVLMFVHLYITKKVLKVDMYDDKYMFLAFFVVLGISAVFMTLYKFYLIRYIVLAVVIVVYYFTNRNMIRKVIRARLKKKA
jgi:O-antigen/teichoic acid export membrane protein